MWARLNNDNEISQLYTRPIAITLDGVQYPASIFTLWSATDLKGLKIWTVDFTNSSEDKAWYDVSQPDYTVLVDGAGLVRGVNATYTNTPKPIEDIYAIPVVNSNGFIVGGKIASSATYNSAAKQGTIISKGENVLNVEITKGTWGNGNTVRGFNFGGNALSPAVSTTITNDAIPFAIHSRSKKWNMIQEVKDIQGNKLQSHDWYYIRKTDTGTAVPADIQTYRNAVRSKATDHENAITAAADLAALQTTDVTSGWPEEPTI